MSSSPDSSGLSRRRFLKNVTAGAVGFGLAGRAASSAAADEKKAAPGKMRTRTLGRTGLEVSVVGFGGVPLRPEHLPLLLAAAEKGVTLFDVAWGYGRGQAEIAIGQMLESKKVKREKIVLMTKGSGFRPPSGGKDAVYDALMREMEAALDRMKTDHVEVLFWPHGASSTGFLKDENMKAAMTKLREKKVALHFGVSTHSNYAAVGKAVIEDGFFDVLMPVVNVCTQKADRAAAPEGEGRRRAAPSEDTNEMLAAAKDKKVGVVAMKAANPRFLMPNTEDLLAEEFPEETTLSRHQKLYRYILTQPAVSTVVMGITTVPHLKEMIEVGQTA